MEISTVESTKKNTVKENVTSNEANTTMQIQSTVGLEKKNKDLTQKSDTSSETVSSWLCNGTICEDIHDPKTSEYLDTEVESSLSDEVVMALEESTGWVCNGTTCTDLGPIYNRQTPSDGNKIMYYFGRYTTEHNY